MKIAYMSDLHFEFYGNDWMPELPMTADVLVLAGDISAGRNVVPTIKRISEALPDTQVLFVAGNHEFYHVSIDNHLEILRLSFEKEEKIHFLEKDSVTINETVFLGCTLWTGMDVLGSDKIKFLIDEFRMGLSDFHHIKDRAGSEKFHPVTMMQLYRESRLWLENQLITCDPRNTIVVTHFPPCAEAQNALIAEDNYAAYFKANCGDLIRKYQPKYWIYGHNHWCDRIIIGATTLVSNQGGYPDENVGNYDKDRLIEI